MRIVHVMGNDKFAPDYIDMVNNKFAEDEHSFFLLSYRNGIPIRRDDSWKNVTYISKASSDMFVLWKNLKKADKIIFHGLFSRIVMSIVCFGGLSSKTYCALWGGDLYKYGKESKIEYLIKKHIISNSKGIVMELEDDYYLAQKWYGAKCPYFNNMLYFSNIVDGNVGVYHREIVGEKKVIQIGNSADPSNLHKDVLNVLRRYKDDNIELMMPLSYGDKTYAREVVDYATSIYGNKVNALMDFLPLDEYLKILDGVDIAVFAHKRQQGLGNILSLLAKGKKVYVPKDVTVYKSLKRMGVTIFATETLDSTLYGEISEEEIKLNRQIILEISNENKLIEDWNRVFKD